MTTVIGGSAPSITFSDSTTQSTAALPLTGGQLSGNLTFSTGTNGIVFNNSSASVNSTLNDYETGTWTPIITASSGTITSYTSSGTYTKIGRTVYITGTTTLTNIGSASSVLQSTLPFSSLNTSSNQTGMCRESASTGYFWYVFVTTGGLQIRSPTNGGITWTNNYQYDFSMTYIATF
jgi:hypothetical protein